MKRKKRGSIFVLILLAVSMLSGCKSNLPKKTADSPDKSQEPARESQNPENTQAGKEGAWKTGMAVVTTIGSSSDAGEEDGLVQIDSNVVALTLDSQGRITKCIIDSVQPKIYFSSDGKLITDAATVFPSKNELGEAYGMKKASGIGKEWNQQGEAFAQYVTGKTIEEVKGIAVNENGAPADADLAASVTMSIGGLVQAMEKAAANAKELGAGPSDKLGLAMETNMENSKDSADGQDGLAQASSTFTAVTVSPDGHITSCIIDSTQSNVGFSAQGKITADIGQEIKTKNELGESYGLKAASSIGKEWYEQAEAYSAYVTGKTIEEVKGIAINDGGAPAEADLSASVTIGIADFNGALEKAVSSAK